MRIPERDVTFYLFIYLATKRRINIAKNFNRLSRVHERYRHAVRHRQTDDRQTELRRQIPERNVFTFG